MEIPPEQDNVNIYASYGPKVNHKFYHKKCFYQCIEHPRFSVGAGVFLRAGHKLAPGEEVFTDYGYKVKLPFPADIPWYWDMKANVDKERRAKTVRKSNKRNVGKSKKDL